MVCEFKWSDAGQLPGNAKLLPTAAAEHAETSIRRESRGNNSLLAPYLCFLQGCVLKVLFFGPYLVPYLVPYFMTFWQGSLPNLIK